VYQLRETELEAINAPLLGLPGLGTGKVANIEVVNVDPPVTLTSDQAELPADVLISLTRQ